MFKQDWQKAEELEIKLPTSTGLKKKVGWGENFIKTSSSALLMTPKPLTVWITTNCRKFFKRWECQTTLPVSWETCMQVKKQQLELDMEQRTGFKSGKEYIKAVYCHPAYLNYMQSTSCKMPCWMKHKLESRLPRSINNLRYADDATLMAENKEELESLLMKVKESETVGLNLNIQKDDGIWSHHFKASETCSVVSNSFWPHGLCSPWNSLGQNTGGGSLSLLQGIFPTQGLNPSHLHCRQILYQLRHKLSPFMANRWGRGRGRKRWQTLFSWTQNHCRWWLRPWN